jgi:hypothetical protein
VDETVGRAVIRLDEAIALVGIEEFDCAYRHESFLSRNGDPGRVVRAVSASGRQSKGSRRLACARASEMEAPGGRPKPISVAKFDVSPAHIGQFGRFT